MPTSWGTTTSWPKLPNDFSPLEEERFVQKKPFRGRKDDELFCPSPPCTSFPERKLPKSMALSVKKNQWLFNNRLLYYLSSSFVWLPLLWWAHRANLVPHTGCWKAFVVSLIPWLRVTGIPNEPGIQSQKEAFALLSCPAGEPEGSFTSLLTHYLSYSLTNSLTH